MILALVFSLLPVKAEATSKVSSESIACPSLQFVFARGSGQERYNGDDWRSFEENALRLVRRRGFTHKIMDLEYPAVSVSAPHLTGVGAFVSAGKSFKFGRSVQQGVASLTAYRSMVQMNCPDTR